MIWHLPRQHSPVQHSHLLRLVEGHVESANQAALSTGSAIAVRFPEKKWDVNQQNLEIIRIWPWIYKELVLRASLVFIKNGTLASHGKTQPFVIAVNPLGDGSLGIFKLGAWQCGPPIQKCLTIGYPKICWYFPILSYLPFNLDDQLVVSNILIYRTPLNFATQMLCPPATWPKDQHIRMARQAWQNPPKGPFTNQASHMANPWAVKNSHWSLWIRLDQWK